MTPLSLTNLQVSIGGQNVLNSTLNMTYENFLQQVNLAEQLTSSVCVSLFYVIDTGSIGPRARTFGDRDGGYLSTLHH